MRSGLKVGWRVRLGTVAVLGGMVIGAVAAPATSFAVTEKEYTATFSAECVVGPEVLNLKSSAKIFVAAKGPSEVFHGEAGMFHGAHSTITTPVSLTENFAAFGANEVKGKATNFVLEGSGGEPAMLNIAKPAEYPEGLPFIAPVEKGKEGMILIPSLKLHETGLTYSFGPEKVTATAPAVLKVLVSSAPGYVETEKGVYHATGNGLVTVVEGLKEGSHVIGPLTVACNPPANVVAAEIPVVAGTPLEEGHPEWYSNFVLVTNSQPGTLAWGPMKAVAPAAETEIECVNELFGKTFDEGTPLLGRAAVLGWGAQGDASSGGGELSRSCKFKKGTSTGEAWITDEPPLVQTGTLGKRGEPLSVPWNSELRCGQREEEITALVKVGIPTATAATPGCKFQTEEATEIEKEESERKGCFAATVPAGCIKVDLVAPSLGLEQLWEGTLRPRYINGFGSGLNAAKWKFEGPTSGRLHLSTAFSTTMTWTGEYRFGGFAATELMTVH